MTEPVRLFGRLRPLLEGRRVESISLRIAARDLPHGAAVHVADVQLQPGRFITGWVPASRDRGLRVVDGWQWRNGVVHDDMTVIIESDVVDASPTRWDVRGASSTVRIGDYHFGHVTGSASVDGAAHTATQGAGIPPHLTARSDVDVDVRVPAGRALLTCWFRGVASTDPDVDGPPADDDPPPWDWDGWGDEGDHGDNDTDPDDEP